MGSQFQEPLIPAGTDAATSRLTAGLRDLVRTIMRSGAFLLRPGLGAIMLPSDERPRFSLRWFELNRVLLSSAATVHLPRIRPEAVGLPLKLIKLSNVGTLTLQPTGLSLNGSTTPSVNDAPTVAFGDAGLYELVTDGTNWFAGRGV